MRKRAVTIGLLAVLCFGVLTTRAFVSGRAALARGDAAQAADDIDDAIWWWRRAARWYVPFAPHVSAAYQRLEAAANTAESNHKTTVAIAAWSGVRSSILATRTLWTPFQDKLEPANQHLAALMASIDTVPNPADPGGDRVAWHLARLGAVVTPSVLWTIVALIGFTLWIGGATWFAHKGLGADNRLELRIAARCGGCVAFGLAVWLLGLFQA